VALPVARRRRRRRREREMGGWREGERVCEELLDEALEEGKGR